MHILKRAMILILVVMTLSSCGAPPNGVQNTMIPSAAGAQNTPAQTDARPAFELTQISSQVLPKNEVTDRSRALAIAKQVNRFNAELMGALKTDGSFVFSPFSLYMALSAIVDGAAGDTYEQLAQALCPPGMSKDDFLQGCRELLSLLTYKDQSGSSEYGVSPENALELDIATLVCVDSGYALQDAYAQGLGKYFSANIASADFDKTQEVVERINTWANEKTRGLVPSVLHDIDPEVMLILANSVYFSGKWQSAFDQALTVEQVFHGTDGDQDVLMMHKEDTMAYAQTQAVQAVRLPYYGGAYMDIFLPQEGHTLSEAIEAAASENPSFTLYSGVLELPKFTIETYQDLKGALSGLDLDAMFDGGLTAIAQNEELLVSDIFQKAKIEVDEEGTKAAAVTVMMMKATSAMLPPDETFEMICDQPFAYRIVYRLGDESLTLFIGAYSGDTD